MLMTESLVNAHIVVSPAEMCRSTRLYTRTRASGYGIDSDICLKQSGFGQRQQAKLYTSGKTSGISHMSRLSDGLTVQFRQTVNVIVTRRSQTEILCQINDLHMSRNFMLTQKFFALAMTKTEEYHIHLIQRQLISKGQISITVQSFVYISNLITGIARTVDEYDLSLRMI